MTPRSRNYFQRKKIKYGPSLLEELAKQIHQYFELADILIKAAQPIRRQDEETPSPGALAIIREVSDGIDRIPT